jgi:hypothetical protein
MSASATSSAPSTGSIPSVLPDDARALYDQTKKLDRRYARAPEPRATLLGATDPIPAWLFVDIPQRLYEAVREVYPESRPPYRARPFDVQIIGAVVLYEGRSPK